MILITNSLLDIHIRTKTFSGWSGIEAAVIRIGGDKLEVQEPSGSIIFNNIISTASPPATVGGYPFLVLAGPPVKYRLNMTGGQYIELTRTYGNTLQVDVKGHGSNFGSSQGLCGNWTANSPNALVDRDKVTVYPLMPIQNAYGEEWQVDATVGDPLLFQTNSSTKCVYSLGGRCKVGTTECQNQVNEAKNACANVPVVRNAQANCEFDVLTTGDVGFAKSIAYTDPIIGDPPEICTEIVNATANGGCKDKGGRCVWRCDKNTHICVDTLCRGPTDGCSCALPFPSTRAPTAKPMTTPVTAPVKSNDTRAPTAKPITTPVATPVKPSGTRAPTMKPVAANPALAPIKPVATAPVPIKETKPPTQAPKKDTRKPTKAPTRKRCGLFGLSILCFRGCGLVRRLFGYC